VKLRTPPTLFDGKAWMRQLRLSALLAGAKSVENGGPQGRRNPASFALQWLPPQGNQFAADRADPATSNNSFDSALRKHHLLDQSLSSDFLHESTAGALRAQEAQKGFILKKD